MNIRPSKPSNAINAVVFALELERPFSDKDLADLAELHQGDSDELPKVATTLPGNDPGLQLLRQIPFNNIALGIFNVTFSEIHKNGKDIWTLTAQDKSIFVRCFEYTNWDTVVERAIRLLNRFLIKRGGQNNKVVSLALEYMDEFVIQDAAAEWKSELLKKEPELIPDWVFEVDDFWHLHSGWFEKLPDISEKVLNRINIDYIKHNDGKHSVAFLSHHRVVAENTGEIEQANIRALYNSMHSVHKDKFKKLISDQMLKLVGMSK